MLKQLQREKLEAEESLGTQRRHAEEQSRLHAAARHGEDALQSTLKACQAELAKARASETKLEQSKLEVCCPPPKLNPN